MYSSGILAALGWLQTCGLLCILIGCCVNIMTSVHAVTL